MREQWASQRKFTERYLKSKGLKPNELTREQVVQLTKEYVLSLHREADEILDEVPWKGHRTYDDTEPVKSNVGEEIADVMKFAMGLAIVWGYDYDEFVEELDVKSMVIEDRWWQEHDNPWGTGRIVLLDLDGVLSEYPGPFLKFVNMKVGNFPGVPEYFSMSNIPLELKARLKHEYRQSGLKRMLPPIESSVKAAQILGGAGYEIVILSQRPAEQYHRIYGDTVYWLHRHLVPYRRLIFAPKKEHRLLLSSVIDRIAFAVDDDPDVVDRFRDLGIKTYWLGNNIGSMLDIPEVKACQT